MVWRILFHGFFSGVFKIHRLVWIFLWIFGCFECVSSMFSLMLLLILNFTNPVLSMTSFISIFYHRPRSIHLCHRKPNPARETVLLSKVRKENRRRGGEGGVIPAHTECQAFFPVVRMGSPHPLTP
jgi:hypothetical protein